jgi:hypothetical protein
LRQVRYQLDSAKAAAAANEQALQRQLGTLEEQLARRAQELRVGPALLLAVIEASAGRGCCRSRPLVARREGAQSHSMALTVVQAEVELRTATSALRETNERCGLLIDKLTAADLKAAELAAELAARAADLEATHTALASEQARLAAADRLTEQLRSQLLELTSQHERLREGNLLAVPV